MVTSVVNTLSVDELKWYQKPRTHAVVAVFSVGVHVGLVAFFWSPAIRNEWDVGPEQILANILNSAAFMGIGVPVFRLIFATPRESGAYSALYQSITRSVPEFAYFYPRAWINLDPKRLVGATFGLIVIVWIFVEYITFLGSLLIVTTWPGLPVTMLLSDFLKHALMVGLVLTAAVLFIFFIRCTVVILSRDWPTA